VIDCHARDQSFGMMRRCAQLSRVLYPNDTLIRSSTGMTTYATKILPPVLSEDS